MREPTLEGFGRKLAFKAGLMVVGSLILASHASRGLPTEGLETHIPAKPHSVSHAPVDPAEPPAPAPHTHSTPVEGASPADAALP